MPFKTSWAEKGIYSQFHGEVTPAEIEEANAEVYGDYRFDHIEYFIYDFTDADDLALQQSDVEDSVATDKGASYTNRDIKGALVASDQQICEMIDSYMNMSSELGSPWDSKRFLNLDEARKWLSV